MDDAMRLRLAVVASRQGSARLAARAREFGVTAFTDLLGEISEAELARADDEATSLSARGIGAVLLGSLEYPYLLSATRAAPPCLFYLGSRRVADS